MSDHWPAHHATREQIAREMREAADLIAIRSERLARTPADPCPECDGSGRIGAARDELGFIVWDLGECSVCGGSGNRQYEHECPCGHPDAEHDDGECPSHYSEEDARSER